MTREVRQTLDEISAIICQMVDTERIYLFGSYAYGTPTPNSDFDLYVVLRESSLRPLDAIIELRKKLYFAGYCMPMDILADQCSSFATRCQENDFEKTIVEKGVLLYVRGKSK